MKTLSWRTLATISTMVIVYAFVKKINVAVIVGGVEVVIKLLLYYLHERSWNKFGFGKKETAPFVLWFTGLSGAGKSTLADKIYSILKKRGNKVERLDGDSVRSIFPKTGYTKEERDVHLKRLGYMAHVLERNGIIVVSSFITPYNETQSFVRSMSDNFVEVFVSASLEECEKRDVKGLYGKARAGEIMNFTGIDDVYEVPYSPEIIVDAENLTIDESVKFIMKKIKNYL